MAADFIPLPPAGTPWSDETKRLVREALGQDRLNLFAREYTRACLEVRDLSAIPDGDPALLKTTGACDGSRRTSGIALSAGALLGLR